MLSANTVMLDMCRKLGFSITADPSEPEIAIVRLAVSPSMAQPT